MGHARLLIGLGVALIVVGIVQQGWLWVAVWLGIDFTILGVAHIIGYSGVFGKRSSGSLPIGRRLLFLPLLAFTIAVWHLLRLFSRESAYNKVSDHLFVGRRLLPNEVDQSFDNYVDLTAEFSEPAAIRNAASYICFPILDGAAPSLEELRDTLGRLRRGRTFIHCAQGHGRTGTFAIALLLSTGQVSTVEEGLRNLTAARPGIRLSRVQLRRLHEFAGAAHTIQANLKGRGISTGLQDDQD